MRNEVAHNVLNIDEKEFSRRLQMRSDEFIGVLFFLLTQLYGEDIRKLRNVYERYNQWILQGLRDGK